MSGERRINGHRPIGLLNLLDPGNGEDEAVALGEVGFDLDAAAASVLRVETKVRADALTATMLGAEREGTGILIDNDGLVLTVGYVVLEAESVVLSTMAGRKVEAEPLGHDYETGFGFARARAPLGVAPQPVGDSAALALRDPVAIVAFGGRDHVQGARIVSRRPFAGYWEYMIEDALFTAPPHPTWSGAALLERSGRLVGVGSLFVNDALPEGAGTTGNMFIPTALLPPVLAGMTTPGALRRPRRPWLGLFTAETLGHLIVTSVMPNGPAAQAGLASGDVLLRVDGQRVRTLRDLYSHIWALGDAGIDVPLTYVREGDAHEIRVRSIGRDDFFRGHRSN